MKKVVIIDHFSKAPNEAGNNRFVYLADMLSDYGYSVEVITTQFSHIAKKQRNLDEINLSGLKYKYTMLKEPGYPKNVCLKRIYSHYIFGNHLRKYLNSIEIPDLVYVAVPSLDVGKQAAHYCKKNNVPLIVDVQDLWPEAFKLVLKNKMLGEVVFASMMKQADDFYRQADKIVAVSDTYKDRGLRVNRKNKDGLCIYLGTDLSNFDSYKELNSINKPQNETWITYVGTLGTSYNIEIIIDAIKAVPDDLKEGLIFKVMGNGPYLERFREYAIEYGVRADFLGRLDYPTMVEMLCKSDIAVNPIVKGAAQSIINKHADYAASGLPVISTQECPEYKNLLKMYGCGINCGVESVEDVSKAIVTLLTDKEKRISMGKNSRKMAEEIFDRKTTYKRIVQEIDKLTEK